jgi:hypothetical protein
VDSCNTVADVEGGQREEEEKVMLVPGGGEVSHEGRYGPKGEMPQGMYVFL